MATGKHSGLILDRAESAPELELLRLYREADDAGKRRIKKLLGAARRDELPSVLQSSNMTAAEKVAFADTLPDYEPQANAA